MRGFWLRALLGRLPATLPGRGRMGRAERGTLRAQRDAVAGRVEKERRTFAERARLYRQHPVGQGAFSPQEVERKLANLYRIRIERLEAHLAACERALAAREGEGGVEP